MAEKISRSACRWVVIIALVGMVWPSAATTQNTPAGESKAKPQTSTQAARTMIEAGVPAQPASRLVERLAQNGYTEPQIRRISDQLSAIVRQGLPVEPMVNKVHEGIAKNVSAGRIAGALDAMRGRHLEGLAIARSLTPDPELARRLGDIVTDALAAGLQVEHARAIRERIVARLPDLPADRRNDLATASFECAGEMARLGASSSAVTDTVETALQNRYAVREMRDLREAYRNQARRGSPDETARAFAREVQRGKKPAEFEPPGRARGRPARDAAPGKAAPGKGSAPGGGRGDGPGGGPGSGGGHGGGAGSGSGGGPGGGPGDGPGGGSGGGRGGGPDGGRGGGPDGGRGGGPGGGAGAGRR